MSVKTYVLLEHTHATAQVYLQVNPQQRVRLYKRPNDHAYGQITYTDREGNNRTIRLKLNCNSIFQDEQIEKHKIPANEKYTQAERDALMFRDGSLTTENLTVQKYLEASPQFNGFWVKDKDGKVGSCSELRQPLYTVYDENIELDTEDRMFMLRLKAANKIAAINDVKVAQELMYKLNGSFFKAPNEIKKCRSELIRFLDESDEAMLEKLLEGDMNVDEKTTVLIGKAIGLEIISFDRVEDQVVKISGSKVVNLKEISSEYTPEERKRYFSEFLTSNDGKLLMQDLEKEVKKAEMKETVTA